MTNQASAALQRGLDWIERHLPFVLPEDPFNPEHIKEVAELSILYDCLVSWSLSSAQADKMKALLLDFLSDPGISEWVRKLPAQYSPYVVAYLPLRAAGIRLSGFEDALRRLHRAGFPESLETTPYREIELQYLTWRAGLHPHPPRCGPIYRRTTLARCRNPLYCSVSEVYSITHTLFYLTGVAGPAPHLPEPVRQRALQLVEPLLLHYWRKPDWDLCGELLLNLVALDRSSTPLFAAAFAALVNAWPQSGGLPGPLSPPPTSEANPRNLFQHCYHTTLVGSLLCGAILYRSAGSGMEVRSASC